MIAEGKDHWKQLNNKYTSNDSDKREGKTITNIVNTQGWHQMVGSNQSRVRPRLLLVPLCLGMRVSQG